MAKSDKETRKKGEPVIVSEMTYAKETKGTYVYSDGTGDTAIPSLYIRKTAFKGAAPKAIKVTVANA